MAIANIQEFLRLIPAVNPSSQPILGLSYDAEANTLYVNFKKPGVATGSELTNDGVVIRYEGEDIIDYTVHASRQLKKTA